ncbi:hypothetical protein KL951_000923 [Ogataea haglerorum]|nr:hypothetical protein KL951_000923 [Ogataea haglerorum]
MQGRREQMGQVPALRREPDQEKGRDPVLQRVQGRAFSGDQLRVPRHDVCGDCRGPPAALCARGVRGHVAGVEPDPVSGPAARAVVAGVQDTGGDQPAGGEDAADAETAPRGAAERGLRRGAKTAAAHGGGLRQDHAGGLRPGLQTERGFAKLYTDERHGPVGLRAAADHVRGVPAGGQDPPAAVGAAHEPRVDGDPVPGGPADGVAGHPGGDAAGGVHLLPGVHSRDELCVRGPRADGGAHRRRGEAVPVEKHRAVPAGDERGVEGQLERRAVGRLVLVELRLRPPLDAILDAQALEPGRKRDRGVVCCLVQLAVEGVLVVLLDLDDFGVVEVAGVRLHGLAARIDDGALDDPGRGDLAQKRLDPLGQPAGLHDELGLVETAFGVDVAVNCVDGEHVRRVRVRVPVEIRQRGGLEGVRERVGVVEIEHHPDE